MVEHSLYPTEEKDPENVQVFSIFVTALVSGFVPLGQFIQIAILGYALLMLAGSRIYIVSGAYSFYGFNNSAFSRTFTSNVPARYLLSYE